MNRVLSLLGVVLVVGGLALLSRPAQAEIEQRRIEIAAGEQLQLACPDGHQLLVRPSASDTATVSCEPLSAPSPTLRPAAPSPTPHHAAPSPTPAPASQHPAGCKRGEVFHDSQDWWLHEDPARDFGHLHTQVCFPVNARIDQPYQVTVTSLLHNNPGTFYRLMMQSYSGGLDGDETLCSDSTAVACKSFQRTLAECEASGGTLLDNGMTCRWRDRFTIDPQRLAASGWQQFRFRAFVDEPDGTRMATSTALHAEIVNDQPPSSLYRYYDTYNYLQGRGWYTGAQYATAALMDAEQLKQPVSGIWRPYVRFANGANHDGSPPVAVSGYFAGLDSNFHAGQQGTVLLEGAGSYHGELAIDTRTLSNGWHRLFLKTDQQMPDGHTHSGVLAVWFEVEN
jgi:hypothetical protein